MDHTVDYILRDDIKICQMKEGFRFGCDSIILAYFARMKQKWRVADVGSGSGVIAAAIAKMYNVSVTAIEIQNEMYECLCNTIEYSNLHSLVTPVLADMASFRLSSEPFNAIVCNPPYRKETSGRVSLSETERIAKFTIKMNMDMLIKFCKRNLKQGGKLFFSYDADMTVEAISKCRSGGIEPKRMRFLHPTINSKATLVFIECVFRAGEELIIEPPLFQKGSEESTREYNNIFSNDWNV